MKKERRHWTAEEKTQLLRRHLIEKIPVSKLCEEARLAPSLFHRWQEQLFVNAALALEGKRPERNQDVQRIEKLEQKMRQKDEVLAELIAEHIALKKNLGNSERMLGGAGCSRRGRGLHPALVGEDRPGNRSVAALAGTERGQVLRVAPTTAKPTGTTAGFPAISGCRTGKRRPSWIFRSCIRRRVTGA